MNNMQTIELQGKCGVHNQINFHAIPEKKITLHGLDTSTEILSSSYVYFRNLMITVVHGVFVENLLEIKKFEA